MDRGKIERFFKDQCTPGEVKEVKEWFNTSEGQAFLEEKLDQDILNLQDDRIKPMTSEIRSDKMWGVIDARASSASAYSSHASAKNSYWKTAAAIMLLLVSAMFYVWNYVPVDEEKSTSQPLSYTTGNDQQRILTLSDGTEVRLNRNAQIWIWEDFDQATREVTLKGEAFFEVAHNDEKPFTVHTAQATIKDLGTAFNVRAIPNKQNVQVAVTEGKVAMWSAEQTEEKATELTQGQFGHLDLERKTLQINQFGVANYLSWMNGRLQYDQARLDQVSRQLSRMYDVSFAYSNSSLKELTVTADFERKSLEKVIEVIAMTLHIDYMIDGEKVTWLQQEDRSLNKE